MRRARTGLECALCCSTLKLYINLATTVASPFTRGQTSMLELISQCQMQHGLKLVQNTHYKWHDTEISAGRCAARTTCIPVAPARCEHERCVDISSQPLITCSSLLMITIGFGWTFRPAAACLYAVPSHWQGARKLNRCPTRPPVYLYWSWYCERHVTWWPPKVSSLLKMVCLCWRES